MFIKIFILLCFLNNIFWGKIEYIYFRFNLFNYLYIWFEIVFIKKGYLFKRDWIIVYVRENEI